MKKVIRKNCFETNSSSAHSIVVTKNDTHVRPEEFSYDYDGWNNEYLFVSKDGIWHLWNTSDGFGRHPFQVLTTFKEKFRYTLSEYLGWKYCDEDDYDETLDKLLSIATEIIPNCKKVELDTRREDIYLDENGNPIKHRDLIYDFYDRETNTDHYCYEDKDGVKHKAVKDEENEYEYPAIGSIDHQSNGILTNFLKVNNISLKEFLTNKKYVIVVDGDEYFDFSKLLRSGLIDKDFITEIYGHHGLDMDWVEQLRETE